MPSRTLLLTILGAIGVLFLLVATALIYRLLPILTDQPVETDPANVVRLSSTLASGKIIDLLITADNQRGQFHLASFGNHKIDTTTTYTFSASIRVRLLEGDDVAGKNLTIQDIKNGLSVVVTTNEQNDVQIIDILPSGEKS